MRLFIAVPVPEELKDNVVEIQKRLAGISGIKAVEKENLHFTIKFLGEIGEEKMPEIKNAIEKGCANSKPFEIGIVGIAAFPSKSRARVVWLSVGNGLEEFKRLMENIDEKLSQVGFAKEKEYIPHLTLARVRSGSSGTELGKMLERIGQTQTGTMRVKEVKLVKSTLSKAGPFYEEVYSVKLE
ncbi:RNA 2',3'-cyclic phosphodiesterase [archaeon]|nr:MAG: RNA 2',3'-cyclic phosphodiesterase [archaeon]